MLSLRCGILLKQANEYNKRRPTDIENKLAVTSEKKNAGRSKIGLGIKTFKLLYIKLIRYKDIPYSTVNIANIL